MKLDKKDNNCFYVNNKKKFKPQVIDKQFVNSSFNFAFAMVFEDGHHREHRSGGKHYRQKGELFANTFQGKLAEFIVYNELQKAGLKQLTEVDVSVYGKGVWDDTDLEVGSKKISIKSTAFFSNLLLLEAKDWNVEGEYIPNLNNSSNQNYDYFLMVRIKPDVKQLFQKEKIFYSNEIELQKLKDIIFNQNWFFDFGGVCSNVTIKHIISNAYFLPQNALLNGTIKMDADNYYIQSGNLKEMDFFINWLKKN